MSGHRPTDTTFPTLPTRHAGLRTRPWSIVALTAAAGTVVAMIATTQTCC